MTSMENCLPGRFSVRHRLGISPPMGAVRGLRRPAEQTLLGQVDMYDSNPPHTGPAGIPNFNGGAGGGGGGGGGDGDGDGGMEDAIAQGMMAAAVAEDAQAAANAAAATAAAAEASEAASIAQEMEDIANQQAVAQAAAAAQAEVEAAGMPTTAAEALPPDIISDIDPQGQTLIEQTYIQQPPDPLFTQVQTLLPATVTPAAGLTQAEVEAAGMPTSLPDAQGFTSLPDTGLPYSENWGPQGLVNLAEDEDAIAEGVMIDLAGLLESNAQPSVVAAAQATAQATPVTDDAMANAIAQGMADVDVPAGVGVAHDAQGQSIEQQLAEIMQTTPYPTQVDVGHVDQAKAQAVLNAQAQAAALSIESGFGTGTNIAADVATQAAMDATGQDPTAGNVDNTGQITEQGLANVVQDIGQNPVAQGRGSPGAYWGANSEVAQNNIDAGRSSGITPGMIATLNAQDHQGYAINNPQPTEASLQASLVFAELNPTVTNAIIGVMGLMPGTIGFASFLVGLITDKGLLNIPAVRAIPGMQTLRDIVDIPRSLVRVATDPFADLLSRAVTGGGELIGEALSQAAL